MSEPLVADAEFSIRKKFDALLAERNRLRSEISAVESSIRDCRAAARLFSIELGSEASADARISIAGLVADAIAAADEKGVTVKEMRPAIEAAYGAVFHPKSIGVALQRMALAGTARCIGHRWFGQSERNVA